MTLAQIGRFAVFAIALAAAPWHADAANVIELTPGTVDLTAAAPAKEVLIKINPDQQAGLIVAGPMNAQSQPWATLETLDGTPCSLCVVGVGGTRFRVRLDPNKLPAGTTSGVINLSSQGIVSNGINVTIGGGTTTGVYATPAALGFTQADVGPKTVTLSSGSIYTAIPNYALTLQPTGNTVSAAWANVSPAPNQGGLYGPLYPTLTVSVNPAGLAAGTYTANLTLTQPGTFNVLAVIPITLTVGGTGRVMAVSPTALSVSTTTPTASLTVTLTSELTNPAVPYTVTTDRTDLISITAPTPNLVNGSTISVTATNPSAIAANTIANLNIVPHAASGFNTINVPITINPQGTTGRVLTPSISQVTLNSFTTAQNVTVVPSTAEPVPYTLTISSNLQSLMNQGVLYITYPQSPQNIAGAGSTLSFSIPYLNSQYIAPTSGTVTIQPHALTGYQALTIPVVINSGGTGTGTITASPSTLTLNMMTGATVPEVQTIQVASTDIYSPQQVFSATATSNGNWLTVSPSFGYTPQTVSVSVNPNLISTPGTYYGTVTLAPQAGTGLGINIQVTLNVTPAFTVTLSPTSLALRAASGGSTPATAAVQVTPSAGTPAFTTTVTTDTGAGWLTATSVSSTLPASIVVSANPQSLAQGTYTGNVAVVSSGSTIASIPVTLSVVPAANLQLSSSTLNFTHQTTSTAAPPAQTVEITSSGTQLTWAAATSTSWLSISPLAGTTPGSLSVIVNPTGLATGTYNGTVTVSSAGALNSPRTINVALTVVTPTLPQISSVVNSASLAPTVAVPGMIFTIMGTDLGPATAMETTVSGGAVGTTLGEVRVLFDGIPASLLYVSANQINGVMPFELYGRFSTRMQVEYRGQRSRDIELRVADTAPGIYTGGSSGSGQGAILNQNGTLNAANNGEARGNVVVIYGTGMGQTNPASVSGRLATQVASPLASPVRVQIGGRDAQVLYIGVAPGLVNGAMQVNAVIPADAPTGANVPVTVQVGSAISQSNVTVSVR